MYGVMCFHSYLFGHSFKLQTDHKPLLTLFNESKAVSPQTSAMLGIDPSIVRIHNRVPNNNTTCKHMSRLPLLDTPVQTPASGELVLMVERLEDAPISAAQIAT